MHEIWVIARSDIHKILRSRTTYFYALILILSSSSYFLAYNKIISDLIKQGASTQIIHEASRFYLNTTSYIWPLIYCLVASGIGAANLVLEKTGRTLEPLMVTPLSVKQIWAGKSLGLSIVSVIIGLAVSLIMFLGISIAEVAPRTGGFVMPDAMPIVTALLIVPVLTFAMVLLLIYIQLVMPNPRAASAVFIFIMIAVWIGLAFVTYRVQNTTNYYTPVYLGLIVIVGLVSYLVSRSLTPEKVVLSSKG